MLRELRVRDYAVIDDLSLELGPGLNVLTGETGAGKSIIVGALSLLLGERASSDVVRAGEERALIEGVFDVEGVAEVTERLRAAGVEAEEGWLVLRREVQREGRNRVWVNGSPATAGLLAELGDALVELHGQHEHQRLLRRDAQREILDAFAGAGAAAAETARTCGELAALRGRLAERRRRADETRERADFLRFRAEEIGKARIDAGEEDRLSAEAKRLEHSGELIALSSRLHDAVYGGDSSLVDRLGELRRPLDDLARIDERTTELRELAETALRSLEELGRRLAAYGDGVEHDPRRLETVRARLDELYRLTSKYRTDLAGVVELGRAAREELESFATSDEEIRDLEAVEGETRSAFLAAAGRLSAARRRGAKRLERAVSAALPELGMPAGRFQVALEPLDEPGATGAERVDFLVALNPGFQPGPLARVASGGELSRVMLALKTVLAAVDRTPCLIFDEIDAGVGGEVAHRVAERLRDVAGRHQVLVITHLPQIAARAHVHLRAEKAEAGGLAAAKVRRLAGPERVEEVARLLGGDPESDVSRRHAEELLGVVTVQKASGAGPPPAGAAESSGGGSRPAGAEREPAGGARPGGVRRGGSGRGPRR